MVLRFPNGSEVEVNLLSLTPGFGILIVAFYSVPMAAGVTLALGVVQAVLRALGRPEPPRISRGSRSPGRMGAGRGTGV